MNEPTLTEREKDTLDFIRKYRRENGYAPTWREIAEGLYIESPVAIQRYLIGLCEKGYITITPKIPRAIVLNIKL